MTLVFFGDLTTQEGLHRSTTKTQQTPGHSAFDNYCVSLKNTFIQQENS